MPQLSRFYGITVYMYFKGKEHNPAHIHAHYGNFNASIAIENAELLEGEFPPRALRLLKE